MTFMIESRTTIELAEAIIGHELPQKEIQRQKDLKLRYGHRGKK